VVPAAHSCIFVALHWIVHAVVPPHTTVQFAAPAHSAVHPPLGQSSLHVLSPWHFSVEPVSALTLQLLPPAHVT